MKNKKVECLMENEITRLVAKFEKDNYVYTIMEPEKEPTPETLEAFYIAMGKIINR
jgi:hypothetical protein